MKKPSLEEYCLNNDYSELLEEWSDRNDFTPGEINHNSSLKAWWKCSKCGYEFKSGIKRRAVDRTGCNGCIGRALVKGFNDFETRHPDIAEFWADENESHPSQVLVKDPRKFLWKCENCGNLFERRIVYLVKHEKVFVKCRSCLSKWRAVINSSNALKRSGAITDTNPKLAEQWVKTLNAENTPPEKLSKGSHKKCLWRCEVCRFEWTATVSSRYPNGACDQCGQKKSAKNFRKNYLKTSSLAAFHPVAIEEWLECETIGSPFETVRNNDAKVKWKCSKCGYEWVKTIRSRTINDFKDCPSCFNLTGSSKIEKNFYNAVKNVAEEKPERNVKGVINQYKEIDFYWRNLGKAVEFNGVYWHSDEKLLDRYGVTAEKYHVDKFLKCEELGIRLVFVWEDDWVTSREKCLKLVKNFLLFDKIDEDLLVFSKG